MVLMLLQQFSGVNSIIYFTVAPVSLAIGLGLP